jgi:DNA (cytosine-5)-methyltransferase 1
VFPAAAVGARHRRSRAWIVAHAAPFGCERRGPSRAGWDGFANGSAATDAPLPVCGAGRTGRRDSSGAGQSELALSHVADADEQGPQRRGGLRECAGEWIAWQGGRPFQAIWESEPDVGRVAHGVPHRVDRLRGLGNAVVPQCAEVIARAILAAEGL